MYDQRHPDVSPLELDRHRISPCPDWTSALHACVSFLRIEQSPTKPLQHLAEVLPGHGRCGPGAVRAIHVSRGG